MAKKIILCINLVLLIVVAVMGVNRLIDTMQMNLKASASKNVIELSTSPELSEQILTAMRNSDIVKEWSDTIPDSLNDCRVVEMTIQVNNKGKFDAEWIGAEVKQPLSGDIAIYQMTGTESTVSAGQGSQITLRMITKEPADVTREIEVSYYIRGKKRTFTVVG